ncbi:hypothetical protein [Cardinium endosymbiont of Sogatella furcifera]|nr:hypothetical protein [Cardinium endosymbiont of Sogatella furcifera]
MRRLQIHLPPRGRYGLVVESLTAFDVTCALYAPNDRVVQHTDHMLQ